MELRVIGASRNATNPTDDHFVIVALMIGFVSASTLVAEEVLPSAVVTDVTQQPGTDGVAESGLQRKPCRAGQLLLIHLVWSDSKMLEEAKRDAASPSHSCCCLLFASSFAAGTAEQKEARDTHTHTQPWGRGLLESITVWVLQLGALQSLRAPPRRSSCHTNN